MQDFQKILISILILKFEINHFNKWVYQIITQSLFINDLIK